MSVLPRLSEPGCGCDAPHAVSSLVSIDEALARIAHSVVPVAGDDTVPLHQAVGRVLSAPVLARAAVPPFDNSAMDGYALNTGDLTGAGPWRLTVSDRVPAGKGALVPLVRGSAARIFTGAPVPAGANAVVMQEAVLRQGDQVLITDLPAPGTNIRATAEDLAEGALILPAGHRLRRRDIAACAAAGAQTVQVRRPIRVALLVTGDEVQAAGTPLNAACIWDVNTPMLQAEIASPAVALVETLTGADDRAGIGARIAALAGTVDLIVTTGGVSVGEEDHVKPALRAAGAELLFSGVAMKPGKPVSLGRLGSAVWLGLPGNPLAAFMTWHLFGMSVLAHLAGQGRAHATRRHVVLGQPIRRNAGRCELRLAQVAGFDGTGREVVGFEAATHSARVGRLPDSDGFVILPAEADYLNAGALVEYQPFCET
ncbi:MAG: molybdopterin molybdotransferase MoeA [Rhodobacteraceae bacterium]|nr:molybdopterin molybdotransferase MoeA [Paracoccaceae bacterium]